MSKHAEYSFTRKAVLKRDKRNKKRKKRGKGSKHVRKSK